ncbi:GntR family transcriptional regulator [Pseudoruegeria sp. SK021]|uniref:GntR family transcriptional regulator n=1 Tax=Pseudoruegeria sp. SK021 TaxID=1933035 RepID=UPI000A234048|nr:GntR family transcriptional regulator [Pseudoruegeria sp. SK021]OSP53674.1 hypothetical protein BV911_16680 [Pseudoruegeria sp. SK021]
MSINPIIERPTGPSGRRAGEVLERLRFDILSMRLAPGEVLSERRLKDIYEASRTPIREALFQLEAEGLVVRSDRAQTVAPFDLAEIDEAFAFRDVVEPTAVRLAATHGTLDDLARIQTEIDAGHAAFTPAGWLELGLDFHVRVAELSGNRCVVAAMRDVTLRTIRARWLAITSDDDRQMTYDEHSEILALLRDRRAEDAVDATRRHAAKVRLEVLSALENSRPILGRRSFIDSEGA